LDFSSYIGASAINNALATDRPFFLARVNRKPQLYTGQ
jgi:hypothetical protein